MSYFDDIEDSRSRIHKDWPNRSKKHLTAEAFESGDGRFLNRNTLCGLVFSQSSGRVVKKLSKATCRNCITKHEQQAASL